MANISPVLQTSAYTQVQVYKWANATENDNCLPLEIPLGSSKTIQIGGSTFGSPAGTVTFYGNVLPGIGGKLLHNLAGDDLVYAGSAAKIFTIQEATYSVQPVLTVGTGMNLDIYLMIQGI